MGSDPVVTGLNPCINYNRDYTWDSAQGFVAPNKISTSPRLLIANQNRNSKLYLNLQKSVKQWPKTYKRLLFYILLGSRQV